MASASEEPESGIKKNKRGIWLIGGTLDKLSGCKLPSNKQVLGRFFELHSKEKKTINMSATTTARELVQFWQMARIPLRQEFHIINKIKELHARWQGLKKNASRKTETQQKQQQLFVEILDDLFDVAHADALSIIKIAEDREFLEAQREKGRRGSLGSVDTKLAKQEERQRQRLERQRVLKQKETKRQSIEGVVIDAETVKIDNPGASDESDSQSDTADHDCVAYVATPPLKRSRPSVIVVPAVAAAFDRTKVSNRNAAHILAATAQTLGHDPAKLVINRESIRRARRKHRENIAKEIRASFSPDVPLTVHWDGKMLPALTSKETVDRLAVLVSGEGTMKLLGVPALPNGTGEAQASSVFNLIEEWGLAGRIRSMSFDTTSSNTGLQAGACVLLERKLGRILLSLACRHHIHELIVAKVFDAVMAASSGPTIKLFERFAKYWGEIDKDHYESGMMDKLIAAQLEPVRDHLVSFIQDQLNNFHARDDYKELLQLALLFLGVPQVDGHRIIAPGACHRARWMAKLIYCLKIYLFRSQFDLTAFELKGLREFNVFVLQVYIKAWYTCQSPVSAPRNDLELLKQLIAYKSENGTVAAAAIKSFCHHLWYLSETLVGLAFFDSAVSDDIKVAMVEALERPGCDEPPKRIEVEVKAVPLRQLPDFVTSNTVKLFIVLDIHTDFLQQHPSTWETNVSFQVARRRILSLKVVNDAAERGVALVQSFNAILTNQEEQKQYLLQLVEKHRKDFPDSNKQTIVQGLEKQ